MKKTLVAVAAMAAVTGAMANATIYGVIDQAITKSTTTVAGVQTKNTTGTSAYQMGDSILGFKGEEDLGGGLKASFTQEFGVQTQVSSSLGTRQAFVGLSGGFGALTIGKQYSAAFFNVLSSDPFGGTGGTGALYVSNIFLGNQGTSADNPLRQDQAIRYELPALVPGMRMAITKVLGNADTGNGSGAKVGDSTGLGILYASGPLNVGYTTDSIKGQSIAAIKGTSASGSVATGALVTTAAVAGVDAAATSTTKLTTFAAGYDLGMAKLTYADAKIMNAGKGVKVSLTGIAVPMGAAKLMLTTSSGKANALLGDTKLKGMQYGGNYALSKRTVAYLHINNSTSTTVANVATKVKGYGLGIHHSF